MHNRPRSSPSHPQALAPKRGRSPTLAARLDDLHWRDEALLYRLLRRVRPYPRYYEDYWVPPYQYITHTTALARILQEPTRSGKYRPATRKQVRTSLTRLAKAGLLSWESHFRKPFKGRKGQQGIRVKILGYGKLREAVAGERAGVSQERAAPPPSSSRSSAGAYRTARARIGPPNAVDNTAKGGGGGPPNTPTAPDDPVSQEERRKLSSEYVQKLRQSIRSDKGRARCGPTSTAPLEDSRPTSKPKPPEGPPAAESVPVGATQAGSDTPKDCSGSHGDG
jgi:hypothetical protein